MTTEARVTTMLWAFVLAVALAVGVVLWMEATSLKAAAKVSVSAAAAPTQIVCIDTIDGQICWWEDRHPNQN